MSAEYQGEYFRLNTLNFGKNLSTYHKFYHRVEYLMLVRYVNTRTMLYIKNYITFTNGKNMINDAEIVSKSGLSSIKFA